MQATVVIDDGDGTRRYTAQGPPPTMKLRPMTEMELLLNALLGNMLSIDGNPTTLTNEEALAPMLPLLKMSSAAAAVATGVASSITKTTTLDDKILHDVLIVA